MWSVHFFVCMYICIWREAKERAGTEGKAKKTDPRERFSYSVLEMMISYFLLD